MTHHITDPDVDPITHAATVLLNAALAFQSQDLDGSRLIDDSYFVEQAHVQVRALMGAGWTPPVVSASTLQLEHELCAVLNGDRDDPQRAVETAVRLGWRPIIPLRVSAFAAALEFVSNSTAEWHTLDGSQQQAYLALAKNTAYAYLLAAPPEPFEDGDALDAEIGRLAEIGGHCEESEFYVHCNDVRDLFARLLPHVAGLRPPPPDPHHEQPFITLEEPCPEAPPPTN